MAPGGPLEMARSRHLLLFVCAAVTVAVILLTSAATCGQARKGHASRRHRPISARQRQAGPSPLLGHYWYPHDFFEQWLEREVEERLEPAVTVANERLELAAYKESCRDEWSYQMAEGFGCPRAYEFAQAFRRGLIQEVATIMKGAMVTVTVHKENRLQFNKPGRSVTCMAWLVDSDLVLTHATCVGPLEEFEVPTKARVYPYDVGASSEKGVWASRVCYSHKLYWPPTAASAYELAVLQLAEPIVWRDYEDYHDGYGVSPLCRLPSSSSFSLSPSEAQQQQHCSLVSVCSKRDAGINTTYARSLDMRPVRRVTDDKLCREKYAGNGTRSVLTGKTPRQLSCWESAQEPKQKIRDAVCKHEYGRAVFCTPDSRCWKMEEPAGTRPRALMVGLGPMQVIYGPTTGKEDELYKPLEEAVTEDGTTRWGPTSVTTMIETGALHEQLNELLVDVRLHSHGGSARSICRNLDSKPPEGAHQAAANPPGYARRLKVSNAGYKLAKLNAPGPPLARSLTLADVPGGPSIDAFDCRKCFNAPASMNSSSFVCNSTAKNGTGTGATCPLAPGPKLPFLVELRVRKRFRSWSDGPGELVQVHLCEAWLVSRDTALAHAECVGPEGQFDSLETVEIQFPKPTRNSAPPDWPKARPASVACWSREAAPYNWRRPTELAVVRFAPLERYFPSALEPACLPPLGQAPSEPRGQCTLAASCAIRSKETSTSWSNWTDGVAVPTYPATCRFSKNVAGEGASDDYFKTRYMAQHFSCWESTRPWNASVCTGTPGNQQAYTTLCSMQCKAHKSGRGGYLAAVSLSQHVSVRQNEPALTELQPLRAETTVFQVDLVAAQRQILELLLALRADSTGTRDVVCQKLKDGASSRRRKGSRRRAHKTQHRWHHHGHQSAAAAAGE